jgi:hypothetical protein
MNFSYLVADCGESGCRRFPCSVVDSCELRENVIWIKFDTLNAHNSL